MLLILRLNWPRYLKAVSIAALGLLLAGRFDGALRAAILLAVASTTFWTTASLAASWWIYNKSRMYELNWLDAALRQLPGDWLNLHNGLDEMHAALRARYPASTGRTLDIFDPAEMAAPSILEARRHLGEPLIRQTNWRYLPASNQTFDTAFIVFTAHEIRRPAARERLFIEVQRVLRDNGRVVVVEHLRDACNFTVFGPGAFHFLSRRAWLESARPAGLTLLSEVRITPFVHAFVFGKRIALTPEAAL
jgi:SAM-dependent methyltransferase